MTVYRHIFRKMFIKPSRLLKLAINKPNRFIKLSVRKVSQDSFGGVGAGSSKLNQPLNTYYDHYTNLDLPQNKILATYVWIDGSGIHMRSKDRILKKQPNCLSEVPNWAFDGSSTGQATAANSDTLLVPAAMYRDPFRKCPHLIILCETYHSDGTPTATNFRAHCAKIMNKIADQEPWFGLEQEYSLFDHDYWPLGWPKSRGYPVPTKHKYSYCGHGPFVAGREIVECHTRACLYAGLMFEGTNAEVMKSSWEFQIGTATGIRAADDLWMGRFLLTRVAENFGAINSFHPKPMGSEQPGIGCHHNFSVKKMRAEGGIKEIERVCKLLCDRHMHYMKNYGLGDGSENIQRLTGEFETASFETCKWGVADRTASVRLQRSVATLKRGFLEDRRPAGNCDPYRVCALLGETCLKK